MLERQERRSWHDKVTLDESWFYFNVDHELIWLQPDEETPEGERHTVQSEKVMITIIWNPGAFHLIKLLPKGFKFDAVSTLLKILIHSLFRAELRSEGRIESSIARR
jgi:hypothetical protein